MAIRQAQSKIPEHLPAAHLMLDDIEQLTAILSGTAKRDNYGHSRAQVKYIVDGVTECDNIDDLKRLGSKHHEFEIKVSGGGNLSFSRYGTHLYFSSLAPDKEPWAPYGQIQTIFLQRSRSLRNAWGAIPGWIGSTVGLLLIFGPMYGLAILMTLIKSHGYGKVFYVTSLLFCYGIIGLGLYKLTFQHSIVELRYAHEASGRRERWKSLERYLLLAVGAILYALAERIVKSLWP